MKITRLVPAAGAAPTPEPTLVIRSFRFADSRALIDTGVIQVGVLQVSLLQVLTGRYQLTDTGYITRQIKDNPLTIYSCNGHPTSHRRVYEWTLEWPEAELSLLRLSS